MASRHDALVPLSHDHHHTLAQARKLREGTQLTDLGDRRDLANDFLNFYFGRAIRHFHEEEELFFAPLVDEPRAKDLVIRAVTDHLRLHALVRSLKRQLTEGEADPKLLSEIAALLTEHVRFEEKELFPLVEELVPDADLKDLALTGRRDV